MSLPKKGERYTQTVIYHDKKSHTLCSAVRVVRVVSLFETRWKKRGASHESSIDRIRLLNIEFNSDFVITLEDWPITIKKSGTWIIYKPLEE